MRSEDSQLYMQRLPMAHKFQDFVAFQLQKQLGISISNFQTKEYQCSFGENIQGFEIKFDNKFKDTQNLWIEVKHRVSKEQEYYNGGILRPDNSWLYCIGNYEVIFIFPKNYLVELYKSNRYPVVECKEETSLGYLLPEQDAEKYCANKLIIEKSNSPTSEPWGGSYADK